MKHRLLISWEMLKLAGIGTLWGIGVAAILAMQFVLGIWPWVKRRPLWTLAILAWAWAAIRYWP
jgi:hypothetical protein